ncbi:methyl-accepting chemotaxis protein [Alkalispirochaeta americana]|uniref:Methyl-accepting chemotaxis protein n=1 Tax=Alkalispirochaeta americana TaxID=159291 RepID=A0A1N6QFL7_9SPIO|nr:methyl-accepting chemotaxis protein [Alkalispirochaeta americana]SIQ15342.1 methyl-accepting chemotaxis protein [Alkalispirochaeta americana]
MTLLTISAFLVAAVSFGIALLLLVVGLRTRRIHRQELREIASFIRDNLIPDYGVISTAVTATGSLQEEAGKWTSDTATGQIRKHLEAMLLSNTSFFGVWVALKPGTLREVSHGHHCPYLYREGEDILEMQLPNIEEEHFFILPQKSGHLELLEPFEYDLKGEQVLMTTMATPIFREGEILGVCGVDIRLRTTRKIFPNLLDLPPSTPLVIDPQNPGSTNLTEIRQSVYAAESNMREMLSSLKELLSSRTQLETNVEKTRAVTEYIAEAVTAMIEATETQGTDTREAVSAVEQMSRSIESLSSQIQDQSTMVEEASAAIEEMVANILSLQKLLASNAERFSELDQRSKTGNTMMQEVVTIVQEISSDSIALNEANGIIAALASQTNLLAMNAAIEAAHAGEFGQGFSVVAGEIRKLAENSATQAKTISGRLKSVRSKIGHCVDTSGKAQETILRLDELIQEVRNREQEINGAMSEQAAGSTEVTKALHHMVTITDEVSGASREMNEGRARMVEAIQSIDASTRALQERTGGISRQAAVLEETVTTVETVVNEIARTMYINGVA